MRFIFSFFTFTITIIVIFFFISIYPFILILFLLSGALSSAIISEKPNVSWDDVAGDKYLHLCFILF